jgi:C4-dicarboxylate-specific signal transduction histidine kinase
MVDITRIKDLEQIVTAREKLASLGHLAAGIAHEIRNPLSGININISTLDLICGRAEGMALEEKEKIRAVVAQAKTASDKIGAVVKRIMEYSKPIPPRMERIDVVRVVRETLALSAASIRKSQVVLLQELSPDPLYCRADATLLEQAVLNLITNALQAMETIDREKFLTVAVAQEGQQVVIRVADNGPGVSGDLLEKIFDPFFTTRKEGYGIGLSFSHRVVSEHNGRLIAGAAEGGGAVFRIELPLWRDRRIA